MTIFEAVKTTVTPRMAAEHFGLSVSRSGMVCCPFHDDLHPSMKDNRVEAKREADNVLLFMRSEGYIQLNPTAPLPLPICTPSIPCGATITPINHWRRGRSA